MKMEEMKKLINNVIENEFNHIQEDKEHEETLNDTEIRDYYESVGSLLDELAKVAPEHKELIDKLDAEVTNYWSLLCKYYFKKGIIASATNLKFLEDVQAIVLI